MNMQAKRKMTVDEYLRIRLEPPGMDLDLDDVLRGAGAGLNAAKRSVASDLNLAVTAP